MPLPLAAAAAAAGRKAALSAARKAGAKTKKRFKESAQKATKTIGKPKADARKKISWVEIIFVALVLALPNDLLDIINLTGVGKIITILIEPLTLILISLWFWLRVRQRTGRKIMRLAISFVAEIIPVIGLAPIWTILVLNVKLGWLDPILNIPAKFFKL